jgi:hypothetical protein
MGVFYHNGLFHAPGEVERQSPLGEKILLKTDF